MSAPLQPSLFDAGTTQGFMADQAIVDALEALAQESDEKFRGGFYTRVEVVHFILDLVGYVTSCPLHQLRILEPSFGQGDFLLPIIDRLLHAWKQDGGQVTTALAELQDSVIGVELHQASYETTHQAVVQRLQEEGIPCPEAHTLADRWLIQGDFLLEQQESNFDVVVGNPPYVRQERIPAALLTEYRRRYCTIYDRGDLYILFIERTLSLLKKGGVLGFICPDRWIKNRYGGPLRALIAQDYHVKAFIDMDGTDAFCANVSAYPAITILERVKAGATRVVRQPIIEKNALAALAADLNSEVLPKNSSIQEIKNLTNGSEPWLITPSDHLSVIRRIEESFPTLEEAGCQVGIGVATGADSAFIGTFETLNVESDRKVPLVKTQDIRSGEVIWQGLGVINPFNQDGSLVSLHEYPRLARYLDERRSVIARRHCARKSPKKWYRTIDRILPDLVNKPKLLIPDIKGEAHVVFEPGHLYPHHNLYYITSNVWDLRALQAVLLSDLSKLFIAAYSTTLRGGYLRFQAQYLRRIRIPYWDEVPESLRHTLIQAAVLRDISACNAAVFNLYQLSNIEISALTGEQHDFAT